MQKCLLLALVLTAAVSPAQAQQSNWDRVFPSTHYFDQLLADPNEPRMMLALARSDVFERATQRRELRPPFSFPDSADAADDVQIMIGIGGSLPLWLLADWGEKGGVVASAQFGVQGRFRIEYRTREDTGQDWYVGMPIEVEYEKFSGRFRIMHRSTHIGDELVETTGARRIEMGGEFADFLAAYHPTKDSRFYGGATWNFRSYTERLPALVFRDRSDAGQVQAGFEAGWHKWSQGRVGLVGGVDWQMQQRTNWRSQFSATAGINMKVNQRATRLVARWFHGPSTMGEFFLTPETFWALEWGIDF